MLIARQSTARTVMIGPVLDADGVAVTDGVVGDFKISKNGAAPAALNGSATLTHRNTGHYSLALTATDLDTVGQAEVVIDDTVNGCATKEITVIEEAVYDAIYAASAPGYLQPTTAGRTLDVSATGEAGIDWANVGSPTTTLALTGTTIATTQKVDVETIKTNPVVNAGTITFPTGATLASTTNITAGTITTVTTVTNQLTAAQIATGVWKDTTAGDFTVASSIGKSLYTTGNAPGAASGIAIVGSNMGTVSSVSGAVGSVTGNVGGNVTGSVGSVAAGGITASSIAADAIGASELAADAVAEIADAVWDEVLSGHLTAGSTGNALNAAGSAGDPWSTSLPGAYGAGSAGYIIGTNIDALITSRMATYTQPTGFLAATFPTTVASTTNITAGTITSVLGNVNGSVVGSVNSVASIVSANVLSINSVSGTNISGLNALGTAYNAGTLTTNVTGNITGNLSGSVGSVTGAVGSVTGNVGGNVVGSVASVVGAVGSVTAAVTITGDAATAGTRILTMIELDGSVYRYTTNALEQAPSGGGSLTVQQIVDGVWDEALSGHLDSGSTGEALNAAGAAGDPWITNLPGSYTGTQAGFILGTIRASTLTVNFPLISEDNSISMVIGDDYYAADGRGLSFNYGASPSLTGATVRFKIQLTEEDDGYTSSNTSTSTTGTVSGTTTQVIAFDIPGTATDDCSEDWHDYEVEATLSNSRVVTLIRGRVNMLSQVV